MAATRNMRTALPAKPTSSQVVLTVARVGDGVGIDGLSLSVRQIMQVALALAGGPGTSKQHFVNPTLSIFWYLVLWKCLNGLTEPMFKHKMLKYLCPERAQCLNSFNAQAAKTAYKHNNPSHVAMYC